MADTYGALEFPNQLPVNGEPVGDPGLGRLGHYFKNLINFFSTDAYRSVAGPNVLPVKEVFFHNPSEPDGFVFNTRDLPGFFLYREAEPSYERLSEDIDLSYTRLKALWVPGYLRPEFLKQRDPFFNVIAKDLAHSIELGRHPSYVMANDPDPTATDQGSVIYRVAGIYALIWKGFKRIPVTIEIDRDKASYHAFAGEIELVEQRILDIVADFPAQKSLDGSSEVSTQLNLTFTTPDGARDLAVAKL